jgi:hypothetical protein
MYTTHLILDLKAPVANDFTTAIAKIANNQKLTDNEMTAVIAVNKILNERY